MMLAANKAHLVDASVAVVFHIAHHWRRTTDVQRRANLMP